MRARVSRRAFLGAGAAILGAMRMPGDSAGGEVLERPIPKTGERLPAVGLGTWQVFDVAGNAAEMAQARDTLRVFVERGGRVIDSSPMYGSSEAVTGQLAAELGVQAKLFVATCDFVMFMAARVSGMSGPRTWNRSSEVSAAACLASKVPSAAR